MTILRAAVIFSALFFSALPVLAAPQQPPFHNYQHLQYFASTPNELNIYRVYGAKPGKTLMIIGGIQGDEAGGFLSADLYADLALAQGNLIVVPRANLYSIILNNRGPDGDMNRQFGNTITATRQKQIVEILKDLMAESDVLLNLHEGSGFYRPTWESDMANPKRFGQCIIADTDKYTRPDGVVLDLQKTANDVLARVNPQIEKPEHRMLFNNHQTSSVDSLHKEQRLSATYYALTHCGIPAFGVECSKSISDLSLKVHYHHLVINAFMEYLDIKAQTPALYLPAPEFDYIMVRINQDELLRVVPRGGQLKLNSGDSIRVEHIEGNYNRGFYCSILGMGTINDLGKTYIINKPTQILIRKDNSQIGEIKIILTDNRPDNRAAASLTPASASVAVPAPLMRDDGLPLSQAYLLLEREGRQYFLGNDETLHVVLGDKITLLDLVGLNLPNRAGLEVNLKGYVPPNQPNKGDDRGYVIDTAKDLMPKYGAGTTDGTLYTVVISQQERELAKMHIVVSPPVWEYMIYKNANDKLDVCYPGQELKFRQGEVIKIMDVKSNVISGLSYALLLPGGKQIMLSNNILDTNNDIIKNACQSGHKLRLAWIRSGRGQVIGQVLLSQKED